MSTWSFKLTKNLSPKNQWKLEKFWQYLDKNPEIKIINLNLSATKMRSLFDKDVHSYWETSTVSALSEMIDRYINVDDEVKQEFIEESSSATWSETNRDLYLVYQMYKISWLKEDIKKNGVQAPVQIHKSVESYHCHPGSDKKYALTMLDQVQQIPCFYIWYPDLDPDPFFKVYEYTTLDTPEQFADIFEKCEDPTFSFEWGKVQITRSPNSKVGDHPEYKGKNHFYAFMFNAADIYRKQEMRGQNTWYDRELQYLSYHDSIHRTQMEKNKNAIDDIFQVDEETFNLRGTMFNLYKYQDKSIWLPETFNNFPSSLVDTKWQDKPETSLKFSLDYVGAKGEM
jgi:hypothetical protein